MSQSKPEVLSLPVLGNWVNADKLVLDDTDLLPQYCKDAMSSYIGWNATKPNISASIMATAQGCRREFALKYKYGLRTSDYTSPKAIGTLTHNYLRCLYDGTSFSEARQNTLGLMKKLLKESTAGETTTRDYESLERDLLVDLGVAQAISVAFWKRYGLDTKRWRTIGTEIEVVFQVPGLERPIKAILDRLMYDLETGEIWIFDIKTTSDDPAKFHAVTAFRPQSRIYRLAAQAYVSSGKATITEPPMDAVPNAHLPIAIGKDTPITGIVFEAIKTPTIRQKKKPPQTEEDYIAEVQEWYAGEGRHAETTTGGASAMPEPNWHRFCEEPFTSEFLKQLAYVDRMCTDKPTFTRFQKTMDDSRCRGSVGRSPCVFLPLCSSDERLWETIIKRLYTRRPDFEEME